MSSPSPGCLDGPPSPGRLARPVFLSARRSSLGGSTAARRAGTAEHDEIICDHPYRVWAARHGVHPDGPLPDLATLARLLEPAPTERPAHEQSRDLLGRSAERDRRVVDPRYRTVPEEAIG